LCNMAVEFAAFTGVIPPDDTTFEYVHGRPYAPTGKTWDTAVDHWRSLKADDDAVYDKDVTIDCAEMVPKVTWGTSPGHGMQIDGTVPDPSSAPDANARTSWEKALEYMDLKPGMPIEGVPIDAAFIGSCTNSRLADLREVAKVVKGRHVAEGIRAIVVPGSSQVKLAAEAEGIDKVLVDAGFEWRESGCSMCFYAGGESFGERDRVISSTNRNFENRQGPKTRTHLASPTSVAASALAGKITDVRKLK
jgi:3-isopropylmalate/(R)-2-methylmalate dehydratase large subunit